MQKLTIHTKLGPETGIKITPKSEERRSKERRTTVRVYTKQTEAECAVSNDLPAVKKKPEKAKRRKRNIKNIPDHSAAAQKPAMPAAAQKPAMPAAAQKPAMPMAAQKVPMAPNFSSDLSGCSAAATERATPVEWRVIPKEKRRRARKSRLSAGERLLHNAAVACAILLAVLTVKNIDLPWARAALSGVESALNMRIDLDESIGRLSFVRNLMPESVLVFLDLSEGTKLSLPVEGEVASAYSRERPWMEFTCPEGAEAVAAADGTVLNVADLSGGGQGVLLEHADGVTTITAYLTEATVAPGDTVRRGEPIGKAGGGWVFFEVREEDVPIDPAEMLGL